MMFGKKSNPRLDPSRVTGLQTGGGKTVPRALRKSAFANCTVRWERGGEAIGTVMDVSNSGVLVRLREGTRVPQQVRLSCPTYGVSGVAELIRTDGPDYAFRMTAA